MYKMLVALVTVNAILTCALCVHNDIVHTNLMRERERRSGERKAEGDGNGERVAASPARNDKWSNWLNLFCCLQCLGKEEVENRW